MRDRYDLHTHSVHSDGTTTPAEIAREAAELGLAGFALTDHDTTRGWSEAREAAEELGIEFLPGMEITTRDEGRSTHLLAYGLDPAHGELADALATVRAARLERAREMVRLLGADFEIDWPAVVGDLEERLAQDLESPHDRTFGRPHIADALVAAGYSPSRTEAFAGVLGPGSPYYLPTYAIETADAIRMVRAAGGVPVLAHPAAGRHSRPVDPAALERFALAGLWGLELEHPENRPDWLPGLRSLADEHGLRITGASDYHGAGKANRLGERTSPAEIWSDIRALAAVPR